MAGVPAKVGWKVTALVATSVAGKTASVIAQRVYRGQVGEPPPDHPTSPRVAWRSAVLWALVSGVIGQVVRLLVERTAANAWEHTTGELPPGLDLETDNELARHSEAEAVR